MFVSWQSPGQYYFKPMMKEFRFEPSSQMIEVQEGQNLKITITGYRTAYRWAALSPVSPGPGHGITHTLFSLGTHPSLQVGSVWKTRAMRHESTGS